MNILMILSIIFFATGGPILVTCGVLKLFLNINEKPLYIIGISSAIIMITGAILLIFAIPTGSI